MFDLLTTRRSVVAQNMCEPGPSEDELASLLNIAARVPDHGKLAPWRFIIFTGAARTAFGDVLADAYVRANPGAGAGEQALERGRFVRAPVVVAVISAAEPHAHIPQWEQILSAGAVCQNMLVGATALGYAAQWITEWYAYDENVTTALGLTKEERVAGFIYLGSAQSPPKERARPKLDDIVSRWPDRA
jgi:nitroreductase